MWKLGSKSKAFSTAEVDFLDLCKHSVRSVEDIVNRGNLLNQRQCLDLSSKLSKTTLNIRELVLPYRQPAVLFRPALENLYRYVEKARSLVNECGEEEWWVAAVVQSQNENAFREILLDVSLCYNTIYEQAKSVEEDFNLLPEDLREYSVFRPATDRDIHKDQQDLRNRLEGLANEPSSVSLWDHLLPWRGAPKQYLARYLLVKLNCTSVQSQANTLDSCSAILWTKESEPPGTWGNYRLLGTGAGSSGVCSTKWMGMPCAKKEFHDQESESFFLKEAGILACLKHPCVVNFFCCGNGEERGDRFIAMELMEKSLSKLIEQQRNDYFPLSVVVDIMVQMARGMWYLHNQGVAHRDLKPHNVVVSRLTFQHLSDHFCVKLVDFGMSKTEVNMFKSNTVTAAGIGTTMYRAPEVHPDANPEGKGKVNWFKADVFSFSMTCAHLLSLKRPFRDVERMRELYNELMNGRRPELPTEYPEELLTLLKDCWDSNPHSRPSFMEICKSLEIFRHYFMRGFPIVDEGLPEVQSNCYKGVEFIKTVICLKSSIEGPAAVEVKINDLVPIIPCTCGRVLECISEAAYPNGTMCNMCYRHFKTMVYHCESCNFVADPNCAEIKDEVKVFFHHHPLHLRAQNHYNHKPDVICGFCEESVEGGEWVYRCEQCDFDAHALCTKYPMKISELALTFTLTPSVPGICLSCRCCNGDVEGYYYAFTDQVGCTAAVHPRCCIALNSSDRLCDCSRRLFLTIVLTSDASRRFCGRCDTRGSSWFYNCSLCCVYIHPGCADDMVKEENKWIEAYDKFMLEYGAEGDPGKMFMVEYGNKGDPGKMFMLSKLRDIFLVSNAWGESSSSSSRPQRVAEMVLPTTQKMVAYGLWLHFSTDPDVILWKKVAATTMDWRAKRRAKRMAVKVAWQKVKANPMAEQVAMLENLKKFLRDLQNSGTMEVKEEILAGLILEKLYSTMQVNPSINAGSTLAASSSQFAQLDLNDPAGYGGLTSRVSTNNEVVKGVLTSVELGSGFLADSPAKSLFGEFRVTSYSGYQNTIRVVGKLGVTDAGHWGVTCTCHGQHMSVAKFAQHSGFNVENPGEVVYMEGGQTLVQWRKSLYSHRGVELLLEDHLGWEWPTDAGAVELWGGNRKYEAGMPRSWQSAMDVSYVDSAPKKKSRTTEIMDAPRGNGDDSWKLHRSELGLGSDQIYPDPFSYEPFHSTAGEHVNTSVSRSGKRAIHAAMGWSEGPESSSREDCISSELRLGQPSSTT